MTDKIMIYRDYGNRFQEASQWARDNGISVAGTQSDDCYKGPRFDVTHVYTSNADIANDYKGMIKPVEVIDDEALDALLTGGDEEE